MSQPLPTGDLNGKIQIFLIGEILLMEEVVL